MKFPTVIIFQKKIEPVFGGILVTAIIDHLDSAFLGRLFDLDSENFWIVKKL